MDRIVRAKRADQTRDRDRQEARSATDHMDLPTQHRDYKSPAERVCCARSLGSSR
jgi:hypothetical protein